MLGSDQFNFETPNVIDPGDAPPNRPSRLLVTAGADEIPSVEQVRQNAARLLSESTEVPTLPPVPTSYQRLQSKNTDEDDEDEEEGRTAQLPSVEEARMYAAALLVSSESKHKRTASGQYSGVSSAESPISFDRTVKLDMPSKRFSTQRLYRRALTVTVICVAIVIAIGLAASKRSGSTSTTPTVSIPNTSARLAKTIQFLSSGISSPEALTTEGSPQRRAAAWIADDDQLQYDIPQQFSMPPGPNDSRFVQRYVLAVLYFSMNGEAWYHDWNFLSAEDQCSWSIAKISEEGAVAFGVTCTETLHVRDINLSNNNLLGTLPDELQFLYMLQYLNLRSNGIFGSIPSSLASLSQLNFLDLRRNEISGTLPEFVQNWPYLEVMALSRNQLYGPLPTGLERLTDLKTLALDYNSLTGDLSVMAHLTSLEYVYLDVNTFTGYFDAADFDQFQNLTELTVSANGLQAGMLPLSLFELSRLRILDLTSNLIGCELPELVTENSVLQYFSVADNFVKGTIPSAILNLAALKQLDLTQNQLNGSLPEEMSAMKELQYLYLEYNQFDEGPIPDVIGSFHLRELSLAQTQRTGSIPFWFPNQMSSLEFLDLRGNLLSGTIPSGLWNLGSLRYMLLSQNDFSGELPNSTAASTLRFLALHNNAFSGSAQAFCAHNIQTLTYDCDSVQCSCCHLNCCNATYCYDDLPWVEDALFSRSWQHNYTRSTYAFSPKVMLGHEPIKSGTDDGGYRL